MTTPWPGDDYTEGPRDKMTTLQTETCNNFRSNATYFFKVSALVCYIQKWKELFFVKVSLKFFDPNNA